MSDLYAMWKREQELREVTREAFVGEYGKDAVITLDNAKVLAEFGVFIFPGRDTTQIVGDPKEIKKMLKELING